jgi:hypothetical protein
MWCRLLGLHQDILLYESQALEVDLLQMLGDNGDMQRLVSGIWSLESGVC